MKKVCILLRKGWAEEAIAKLGEAGLLHVSHARRPTGKELSELEQKRAVINNVLPQLEGNTTAEPLSIDEAVWLCERYMELSAELERMQEALTSLEEEYSRTAVWGDFDREEFASLGGTGLAVKLFACGEVQLETMPEGTAWHIISRDGDTCYVAAVTNSGATELPFPLIDLPERPAAGVKGERDWIVRQMDALESEQKEIAGRQAGIAMALKELEERIAFERVRAGMGEEEGVAYLTGFVPVRDLDKIEDIASKNRWGVLAADPGAEEDVPTLLEHSKLTAIFQPVMDFIGVKPGYFEFDTNGIFLLFFSIFFAMIVGDGGYGALILAGALTARRLFPKLPKETVRLFISLSVTTLCWGAVTGNWFGLDAAGIPLLGKLVWPRLSGVDPASTGTVMEICFLLALLHLSAAHLWRCLLYLPSLKALSEAGWVMLLAGVYMIVRFLVLKAPFPAVAPPLLAAGFLIALLFSGQQGDGLVRGIKRGLVQTPVLLLDGIGGLSNIVSYLRLFAVGIASKEVAVVFNGMAADFGFDSAVSILLALFVLIFGHLVNLVLIALSVIVHGIRLNILEFSGQMKMEWTGVPYEPFGTTKSQHLKTADLSSKV